MSNRACATLSDCNGCTDQQQGSCCDSAENCAHSRGLELLTLIEAMKVTPPEHLEYLVGIAERELRGMIEMMELNTCSGCEECKPRGGVADCAPSAAMLAASL